MPRKQAPPVGTCPCPVAKCSAEKAPIFRFANTAKIATDARKAGRYYGRCPNHGWFGYDCAPAMQKYIRDTGTLNGGQQWASDAPIEEKPAEPAPPASLEPDPAPVIAPPSKPGPPAAAIKQPAKRPDVWNL